MDDETQNITAAPYDPPRPPRTLGQTLDQTFRLIRTHWKLLTGISAVMLAVLWVIAGLMVGTVMLSGLGHLPQGSPPQWNLRSRAAMGAVFTITMLLYWLTIPLALAASADASVRVDLGVQTTFREVYRRALRRLWRYVWLMLVLTLIFVVPILPLELFGIFSVHSVDHGGTAPAALFFLLPLVFLVLLAYLIFTVLAFLRLSLVFPVCVAEDVSAMAAIKRSYRLTRGAMGRIFVVALVVYAASYALYLVVLFAAALLGGGVALVGSLIWSGQVPMAVKVLFFGGLGVLVVAGMSLYMAVCHAGFMLGLAVVYNDQRLRLEGAVQPQ